LIISYYWPPLGGPGALRPVKFSKYLPQFGIESVALTCKNIAYHSIDEELGGELKNMKTFRTESLDPARILYLLGIRKYHPKKWQLPIKQAVNFPDNKVPWLPFAYSAARKIKFDAIFVTAPPFSSFILAYLVARETDKPLILDFRDAWLEFPFMPYKGEMQKKFVSHWEKKVTEYASRIICVDENIRNILIKKFPHISQKISVIPNGYDPDDFQTSGKPTIFTIAYLGTIREERNPKRFLESVQALITQNRIPETDIRIKFIGYIEGRFLKEIEKYKFTKTLGHLPYIHAIREFSSSHVGLMITTGNQYFFPSRQNEYLASGLPIIVCGRSKGIHLLEEAFQKGYPGWIYDYDDIDGMKTKIFEMYQDYRHGKIITGETPYKQFTRENLTKKLAGLIRQTL